MATKAKGWGMARGAKRTKRFDDGGEVSEDGRFDEGTYARARKFVESGSSDEEETPKAKPAAKKVAAKPSAKASDTTSTRKASESEDESEPKTKQKPFARIPGPAEGSRADKAIKTYEPPTDDPYAGLKAAGKAAATMAAPAVLGAASKGVGALASRGMSALRAAGKPTTEATAEIGKRVSQGVDDAMFARTGETAKRATESAKQAAETAKRIAPKKDVFGASKRSPARQTPKKSDVTYVRGEYMAKGGVVKARGDGIAQRGKTKGSMR